jgi:uncharacterized protein YukJ
MQNNNYGVLKCKVLETQKVRGKFPHFHIHAIADEIHFRISINIKSEIRPYDVLYYIDNNFQNDITTKVTGFPFGFNMLGPNIKKDYGLDYIRGNLFDTKKLQPLPDKEPGPDNDLEEKIRAITHKALENQESILYAFGQRWGPTGKDDKYFHFSPGDGIHDIHMNQCNTGIHEKENGTWQDGGLLVHFLPENSWSALFLAFQTQSFDNHIFEQTKNEQA